MVREGEVHLVGAARAHHAAHAPHHAVAVHGRVARRARDSRPCHHVGARVARANDPRAARRGPSRRRSGWAHNPCGHQRVLVHER
eukprot:694855-Pyramimonas_sp.AAC.1